MDSRRRLATVLFTDIVGSTDRAAELGDVRWGELLQRHHGVIRSELRRQGGREVATAGDGFLAVFASPDPALRCAIRVRDAVRELGLEIRGGLHMGQIEEAGKSVGGIAVHIGARVAALAGAGDVLVSSTLREAVSGAGYGFEDRGVHVLKGVPGEWRLFAVSSLPAETFHRDPGRRLLRRTPLTLLAALVLLIAGGVYLTAGRGGSAEGRRLERAPESPRSPVASPASRSSRVARKRVSLAVLPFHSLTGTPDTGFLDIGIPDAIITKLANARQIELRPTTAILRYENGPIDLRAAGRELASDYLLTGTLQEAGQRFRASVQLVRASDGAPLWGEHYDLPRADLLVLQDSIAAQVAAALEVRMTEAERERLHLRYTDNGAAYELYLEGRSQLVRYSRESTAAAVEAFREALRLDPDYALAHAGLAMASAQTSREAPEVEVAGWRKRAHAEARRALELDDGLAEAHEALAAVYRNTEFDWDRTIEESRRALALNPNLDLPHVYSAAAFYHLGLMSLAESEAVAALRINPGAVEPLRLRGTMALLSGRMEDAVALLRDVRRLSEGPNSDWYLALALYYVGERDSAEALLSSLRASGPVERRAQATLAGFLAARGDGPGAREQLDRVLAGSYMDHHVAYALGVAYAQLGDSVQALRWLEQATDTGLPCYPWYAIDPLLRPLRRDPEFHRFLGTLRGSWEAAKSRYGEEPDDRDGEGGIESGKPGLRG